MKTALLLAASFLSGTLPPGGAPRMYQFNYENVLGTSLEMKIQARSLAEAEGAEDAALKEIDRQSKILSAWDPDSEFSRWTRTSGTPERVSPELFEVLGLFDAWRDRTGGALDASAEVIIRLWKAAENRHQPPTPSELAAAVETVRQPHWRLDPRNLTAVHLDRAPLVLASFAKSYVAGHAADAAMAAGGVASMVVNIGGDLVVRGALTEPVDIADPRSDAENSPPLAQLAIHDRAVATSGNYRRGVAIGGLHYSHIVDPRTGIPADQIISATVVASNPTDAGALATAFSIFTPAESRKLAALFPGDEFLLVTNQGERIMSQGWPALQTKTAQTAPNLSANSFAAKPTAEWDPAFELLISVELARIEGRARRPYLAVWVEDQDKFPVRTIALWYQRDRWLPELRQWYRGDRLRSMAEGSDVAHSRSSATRSPGQYTLKWDGRDNAGKPVKSGRYTVFIEAAREHGTYQLMRREMEFNGTPQKFQLPGNTEVAEATLDYHKTGAL